MTEEHEDDSNELDLSTYAFRSKDKQDNLADGDEVNKVIRKTVSMKGRSISMRQNSFHRTSRRDRFNGRQGFSKLFRKQFGHLIYNGNKIQRVDTQYKPPKKLPKEIITSIHDSLSKYTQITDAQAFDENKIYCVGLARYFLKNRQKLERFGLNDDPTVNNLCKQFVEWGLYLRSIYGNKFIELDLKEFVETLDQDGNIDFAVARRPLDEVYGLFGETPKRSKVEEVAPRFNSFIDYAISIRYQDEASNPALRQSAYKALEEAIIKYNLHADNLSYVS